MIRVTAFRWVPPFAQGLVRDLRVRWALEEAGLTYEERLLSFDEKNAPAYRKEQPFAQVPVYEEDGLSMFESGAIVLHVAEKTEALLPREPARRAEVVTWMFAALNSVEPHVGALNECEFAAQEEWAKLRRPAVVERVKARLGVVAERLAGREHLVGRFSAADVLMTTVLRALRSTPLVADTPGLAAYVQRCEARPAFQRALAAQLAPFAKNAPPA
jgi:glutathione S-transferase